MASAQRFASVEAKDLPVTFWLLAAGVLLLVSGFVLEWFGYAVEAGLAGAMALIFIPLAILGHILIWAIGKLE